jgi:site-specific DNA recombinase
MKPNAKKRAVIYTRISRVGGRSGDGFISQEIQLEACQDKIEADGLNFLEHIHEEDMSGGNAQRPGYLRAIEMIETGKADVIVIYNIWRFSRTVSDGAKDIDRVTKAGGDLLSCANDIGDNTASGRFQRNVFLALGQMYREQATENFAVAQEKAIERGLYTASKIPFGYRRDPETRKLVAQPEEAATVKKLFEMRTDQESWTKGTRRTANSSTRTRTKPSSVSGSSMLRTPSRARSRTGTGRLAG